MDFLGGNQYLVPPWEGNLPDLRTISLRLNQNAPLSPILGFSYDPTPVSLEITAVANVIAQYSPGLRSGSVDPGENLPKFIKALDDAGAQKMVDEMQRQLDAWRAANNK
jgi:putative aldouronate transport system substrate-binding protein